MGYKQRPRNVGTDNEARAYTVSTKESCGDSDERHVVKTW